MFARYAKENFDSDDWERKRLVIKQLGADLELSGRTIEFTPVKYLIPVAESQECLKAKKRGGSNRFSTDEKRPQRGLNFILVPEMRLELIIR